MIRLIPIDAQLQATFDSSARFRARYGADVDASVGPAREAVAQTLAHQLRVGASFPWGGYLGATLDTRTVVGCCGFTGGPDPRGAVEIAYFTFPAFEGRGFATEMARALVGIAGTDRAVRTAIAHTLPEPNASTRILEKLGFRWAGDVEHSEDGHIWRWSRALAP